MAKTKKKSNGQVSESTPTNGQNGNGTHSPDRLSVLKTYKLYIGGKFPRTESGR